MKHSARGTVADFVVAGDIAGRLAELRSFLGEGQEAFARRFGRGWKQVSAWENQRQTPRPSVLRQAAETNDWPIEIFTEGGPRPSEAVNARGRVPATIPPAVFTEIRARLGDGLSALWKAQKNGLVPYDLAMRLLLHCTEPALVPGEGVSAAGGALETGGEATDQRSAR